MWSDTTIVQYLIQFSTVFILFTDQNVNLILSDFACSESRIHLTTNKKSVELHSRPSLRKPKLFALQILQRYLLINLLTLIFMLPYIIMDLPIFVIAEWATLLVDIRCPRGGS